MSTKRCIRILRHHLKHLLKKTPITISIILLTLISCSKSAKFENELPKKLVYKQVEFFDCPISSVDHLCIKNSDAIEFVINYKHCQEQNKLLRELNGN